jgi:hypothetical protein
MLDIHEFRRELDLESGGVRLPNFSELPRLRIAGRFVGIFCAGDVAFEGGEGSDCFCTAAGAVSGVLLDSSRTCSG